MSEQSSGKLAAAAFLDEAESHVRDISVTLAAAWTRWLHMPAVSGLECVQVLRAAGFGVRASFPGYVELLRDRFVVQVPLATQLAPDVLIAVMIRAGIGPKQLVDLLGSTGGPGSE
jgi:hypothetical protein